MKLLGLTKRLAKESGPFNIIINEDTLGTPKSKNWYNFYSKNLYLENALQNHFKFMFNLALFRVKLRQDD